MCGKWCGEPAHASAPPTIASKPADLAAPNGWPVLGDARHALVAVLRCVDAERATVRIWRPQAAAAQTLLPGRWHIELIEWASSEGAPDYERSLGMAGEITLAAGDDATAQLR